MLYSSLNAALRFLFSLCPLLPSREKANLAVTLANEKDDIVAHASFFDHPVGGLVDQAQWESFLQKHFVAEKCTVRNSHNTAKSRFFIVADVKPALEETKAEFSSLCSL